MRPSGPFSGADLEGLPPVVRRYFGRALAPGQRMVAGARVSQVGEFLLRPPRGWRPFRATQDFETAPPTFRWNARIRLGPGLGVRVDDRFEDGQGSVRARLLGFPLADAGGPDVTRGALQRYLAEAVLLPTALLPREGVAWTALDDARARASLTVGETTAALEFAFGPDGLVESVFTADRPRDVGGRSQPTPWRGRWWDPEDHEGLRVPSRGQVEWLLPDGPLPYWRARVRPEGIRFR